MPRQWNGTRSGADVRNVNSLEHNDGKDLCFAVDDTRHKHLNATAWRVVSLVYAEEQNDYHRLRVGGLILAAVLCLIGITILLKGGQEATLSKCSLTKFYLQAVKSTVQQQQLWQPSTSCRLLSWEHIVQTDKVAEQRRGVSLEQGEGRTNNTGGGASLEEKEEEEADPDCTAALKLKSCPCITCTGGVAAPGLAPRTVDLHHHIEDRDPSSIPWLDQDERWSIAILNNGGSKQVKVGQTPGTKSAPTPMVGFTIESHVVINPRWGSLKTAPMNRWCSADRNNSGCRPTDFSIMDPSKSASASMGQGPTAYYDKPQTGYPPPGYPPQQQQGFGPPPPYGGQGQYPMGQYPSQPATVNVHPTVYVAQSPLTQPVNDYLGYSIFNLLCCCLPLGIAALIYSILAREANHAGDRMTAERNSRTAKILNHVGLGIGIGAFVVIVVIAVLSVSY
ncbi:hypothetical protein INR49_012861 [Caranx melampygus]|nr:hypothetical protein INR49_012861 [Caranx melampygus]